MRALGSILGAVSALTAPALAVAQTAAIPDTVSTLVAGAKAAKADSALAAAAANGFSGVVLVVDGGQVVLRKGYGLAVRERKQVYTPGTIVPIGSNTKDFTAVAILQLQEAGKLSVDDSLGKYFPSAPADKRGITIWQLLQHRSGLPLYSGPDFAPVSRDQFIAHVLSMKLEFPPGTQQRYSNVGYSVLAAIIELLVDDSYGGYVNKHIWQPLGMAHTGLLLANFDTTQLARAYQAGEDKGTMLDKPHADDGPYWNIRGNGGYLSTVSDMYHFYEVLFHSSTLLQPATRDKMFPPDVPMAHAGSDMISFFLYERAPQAGVVLIMATNSREFPAPMARDGAATAFELPAMGGRRQVGGPRTTVVTSGTVAAAVALPDTPAGRRAREYIAVFNSQDTVMVKRFMQDSLVQRPDDHRTMEQRLSSYRGMRAQVGAMKAVGVKSSEPNEITLRVVTGKGEEMELTVTVEAAVPNRIVELRIEAQ